MLVAGLSSRTFIVDISVASQNTRVIPKTLVTTCLVIANSSREEESELGVIKLIMNLASCKGLLPWSWFCEEPNRVASDNSACCKPLGKASP